MTVDYRLSRGRSYDALFHSPSSTGVAVDGITIVHIALQGCLKAGAIEYGRTADTGGHIRYLLELIDALSQQSTVARQIVVTRAFRSSEFDGLYERATERWSDSVVLWRCSGDSDRYLAKEELWSELPTLARDLERRLCRSAIWPDIVHAHYADAGWIAAHLRARFGIPFIFTAHSLGLVKAKTVARSDAANKTTLACDAGLQRRVNIERHATSLADLIVTSSNDEVANQYGLYAEHLATKCVVNPPGCDLKLFAGTALQTHAEAVDKELRRFLSAPSRPTLLALARPVAKKNLTGLLHAYGKSPQLQACANLVICAGNRDDIGINQDEASEIIKELIYLVDYYDLYGRVALPKAHSVEQVPAIYQWAARRRGIFINVALHEPFGLTLLEAAATGLPVVATENGGPQDILERCNHGLLVDPNNQPAIIRAVLTLLEHDALYDELSRNGVERVRNYRWSRHANQYLEDCATCVRPKRLSRSIAGNFTQGNKVLATDLDDTLLGDSAALRSFSQWRATTADWLWVVATGRNPEVALRFLRAAGAPLPDYLICAVGTEIYKVNASGALVADSSWATTLAENWQPAKCAALLREFAGIVPQEEAQQRQFKLSYRTSGDAAVADRIQRLLHHKMVQANVVLSHRNFLDVVAPRASKGLALRHLVQRLPGQTACVLGAGDSGNDMSLIASADGGIVVANHNGELNMLRSAPHVYWSSKRFAAGVLDGLAYFAGTAYPWSTLERTVDVV